MDFISHEIWIDGEPEDGKHFIHLNGAPSHTVDEQELQALLKEAQSNLWQSGIQSGQIIGSQLYQMINGSGGVLEKAIRQAHDEGKTFSLSLKLPEELSGLPFELFHNNSFLLMDEKFRLVRKVNNENRLKVELPAERELKMLFMACSPTDLHAKSVLSFEKEEELIMETVGRYPVSMTVEDSGSLNGLSDRVYEANGFDIVHITGHAGIDKELGPVFYMESDIGMKEKVTPLMLWEKLKDFPPRALFLSGCSTAGTDDTNATESFSQQMVEHGISVVLGWGLPISDEGATKFAAEFYKQCAMGKDVGVAVKRARQEMETAFYVWPLLRIYTDGAMLSPLIAPGQKMRPKPQKAVTYKFLEDSEVKVLETGFVGRRRDVQKGVRVLKGAAEKYGVLIHGTAGLGKSCLSGKLIERFPDKDLAVYHGKLDAGKFLLKLKKLFERKGNSTGMETLAANAPTELKIKELFRSVFTELPTLICLDDFEQNLERKGDEWHVTPEAREVMAPLLNALEWAGGRTSLMITSRYPFVLEAKGEDLARKLEEIPLMSFRGADLRKKKYELKHITESKHADLYMEVGGGNPRLLEWLEKIAEDEGRYDIEELKEQIRGKSEEFIQKYLAGVIADTHGEDFRSFIDRSAVFRQPVHATAFEGAGTKQLLEKGVDLTLFECESITGKEPVYWVTPVIRERMFDRLDEAEKKEMHSSAYSWYDNIIKQSEKSDYAFLEESVHHALESDNISGACWHAVRLGIYMEALVLFREQAQMMQGVADRITEGIIEESIKEKDEDVPMLLNNLGGAWKALGNNKKAIELYEKALAIVRAVFGEKHPYVASTLNNLGEAWRALGEIKKAIDYLEKALAIDLAVFGDKHADVARDYNNLGLAWQALGDNKKAIDYLEKALAIDLEVFGDKHPDVAIDYNNLGWAWQALGDNKKAVELYEKALAIDLKVFGDKHPDVAIDYNNLGGAWQALGDNKKAVELYEKALAIFSSVFGERHPHVAVTLNNLGSAWQALGDNKKAIDYYKKALAIDLEVFGDNHPNVARDYNNLGMAWHALGDNKKAIDYSKKALAIVIEVFGEDHPHTKLVRGNIDACKLMSYA